jgi:hypothetical protein
MSRFEMRSCISPNRRFKTDRPTLVPFCLSGRFKFILLGKLRGRIPAYWLPFLALAGRSQAIVGGCLSVGDRADHRRN